MFWNLEREEIMKLNIVLAILAYTGLLVVGFYAGQTHNFILGLSLGFFVSSLAIYFSNYYGEEKI